jgi:hypothetical protein
MAYGMSHSDEILSNPVECQYVAFHRHKYMLGTAPAAAAADVLHAQCPTRAVLSWLSYKKCESSATNAPRRTKRDASQHQSSDFFRVAECLPKPCYLYRCSISQRLDQLLATESDQDAKHDHHVIFVGIIET